MRAPASRKSYLRALKAEVEADPAASNRRSRAAQERAARERLEKVEAAREALEKLQAEKEARKKTHAKDESKKKEPAASTTDPDARRMRFADGAVRAAYNVQVAVTAGHGFILGIDVTDRRNDAGFARPMAEAVETRLGKTPSRLLADTNYATADDIEALGGRAQDHQEMRQNPGLGYSWVLARRRRKTDEAFQALECHFDAPAGAVEFADIAG